MSILSMGGGAAPAASGNLQKIQLRHETRARGVLNGQLSALFNPSRLQYGRDIDWAHQQTVEVPAARNLPRVEFQRVQPTTLTVELLFDTSEGKPGQAGGSGIISTAPTGVDVVQYTDKVVELTRVQQELHRPPLCELWWGSYRLIRGVLVSLSQDFTLFLPNGTPVRASLSCTFQEAEPYRELHSADLVKRRMVRAGDTLTQIAHEEYGDLSLWRRIAQANDIDNPRELKPGTVLTLPALRP